MTGCLAVLTACTGTPTPTPPTPPLRTPTAAAWKPKPTDSWDYNRIPQIQPSVNGRVQVVDMWGVSSLYARDVREAGARVVCTFSAGWVNHTDPDLKRLQDELGNQVEGWHGIWWLDIGSETVRQVMVSRLETALTLGCDGVAPENLDGYRADTGFGLTREATVEYIKWLAHEAHSRGLAFGLKNAVELIPDVHADMDFAVNESCHETNECSSYAPFQDAGKAVFNAEFLLAYQTDKTAQAELCRRAAAAGLSTIVIAGDPRYRIFACRQ